MAILLDTCAIIWLGNGDRMSPTSLAAIQQAASTGEVYVSPISAWEIGHAHADPKKNIHFLPSPDVWFKAFLMRVGIRLALLSVTAAVESAALPGEVHADPADRFLIATARELGATIVTRDRRIIEYSRQGFVDVLSC